MSSKSRFLCAVYALIAVIALVATMTYNVAFMKLPDNGGIAGFIRGAYANPSAGSLTNDLFAFAAAGCIFMIVEGRRLKMRFVAAYVAMALLVAISVAFPLFLIAREKRLAT